MHLGLPRMDSTRWTLSQPFRLLWRVTIRKKGDFFSEGDDPRQREVMRDLPQENGWQKWNN